MKLIKTIRQKIALRRERKAVMSKISYRDGRIFIDADIVCSGTISCGKREKFENPHLEFNSSYGLFRILTDIKKTDVSATGTDGDTGGN